MKIKYFDKEDIMLVEITEELDDYASEKIRRRVDYDIERFMPKRVIFDFNNVVFMDSSGIGLLIGRYKKAIIYGGKVEVANVKENLKRIFEMSGIFKIIKLIDYSNNYC